MSRRGLFWDGWGIIPVLPESDGRSPALSIVRDDGNGTFKNELDINNTLDPSPYFGFNLNKNNQKDEIPGCEKK